MATIFGSEDCCTGVFQKKNKEEHTLGGGRSSSLTQGQLPWPRASFQSCSSVRGNNLRIRRLLHRILPKSKRVVLWAIGGIPQPVAFGNLPDGQKKAFQRGEEGHESIGGVMQQSSDPKIVAQPSKHKKNCGSQPPTLSHQLAGVSASPIPHRSHFRLFPVFSLIVPIYQRPFL